MNHIKLDNCHRCGSSDVYVVENRERGFLSETFISFYIQCKNCGLSGKQSMPVGCNKDDPVTKLEDIIDPDILFDTLEKEFATSLVLGKTNKIESKKDDTQTVNAKNIAAKNWNKE